jgi:hypothetical protein
MLPLVVAWWVVMVGRGSLLLLLLGEEGRQARTGWSRAPVLVPVVVATTAPGRTGTTRATAKTRGRTRWRKGRKGASRA